MTAVVEVVLAAEVVVEVVADAFVEVVDLAVVVVVIGLLSVSSAYTEEVKV